MNYSITVIIVALSNYSCVSLFSNERNKLGTEFQICVQSQRRQLFSYAISALCNVTTVKGILTSFHLSITFNGFANAPEKRQAHTCAFLMYLFFSGEKNDTNFPILLFYLFLFISSLKVQGEIHVEKTLHTTSIRAKESPLWIKGSIVGSISQVTKLITQEKRKKTIPIGQAQNSELKHTNN